MTACKRLLILTQQQAMVNGESFWKIGKPSWEAVYHYPVDGKDGDIA
jgi:hypothetical protein